MFWPGSQQFWRPLPGCCAPFPSAASGSGGQKFWRPLHGHAAPFPSAASGPGSQRLAAPPPSAAPARAAGRVSGSLQTGPGPVCRVGGGGFSGAEFSPIPPPASFLQRGWGGSSLEFLRPFVLRTAAVCSGRLIFSLALPQFKKAPFHCSQGLLAGPHPKECRRLLSVPPPLAGGRCGRLGCFSAGSCF